MRVAALLACLAVPSVATAQGFELRRPVEPAGAAAQVEGGRKAIVANWPATFVFDGSNGAPCTATAIGPHVLLTAAHCIIGGSTGRIRQTTGTVWCEPAPMVSYGHDLALCASSVRIPIARDRPYETIDAGSVPQMGTPLVMVGYGCTRTGGGNGVLYEGDAKVGALASGDKQFDASGGAALCAGDSGGGAYSQGDSDRRIVGVASDVTADRSRFSLLANDYVKKFIREWQLRQIDPQSARPVEVRICGIDGTSAYCRG